MADERFSDNLMRMLAAELHLLNCVTVAREMFGRGYFSLGPQEKGLVDQTVLQIVGGNYNALTPQFLATQQARPPMGFQAPSEPPTPGSNRD